MGKNLKEAGASLLLAEELPTVPAVVTPLREWEPDCTAWAAVPSFILHPVVSCWPARLITHRPAEHSATAIPNENSAVIPGGKKQKHFHDYYGSVRTAIADFRWQNIWWCFNDQELTSALNKNKQTNTKQHYAKNSICILWQHWKNALSDHLWATHLEMPRAVISAGCALSLRSNAVCIVSLLLNTNWRSHRYPRREQEGEKEKDKSARSHFYILLPPQNIHVHQFVERKHLYLPGGW